MIEGTDYTQLPIKEKYRYLVDVLEKIETNLLYKDEVIEGNYELEDIRKDDIEYMNNVISDELMKDGFTKMFVKGRYLRIKKVD